MFYIFLMGCLIKLISLLAKILFKQLLFDRERTMHEFHQLGL